MTHDYRSDPAIAELGDPFISLDEVGRRKVCIVLTEDGAWRVRFTDAAPECYLSFGPAIYGGTREEAEEDARRVASKWDWEYVGEVPA